MPWLSTAQAAHRLGVKPPTVYAYVSRGLLQSHRDPESRRSRFDARQVEDLAVRGRPRLASRARALDLQIDTSVTQIDGHAIRYRGYDALALARTATFEQVAELLWRGELPASAAAWQGRVLNVGAAVPAGAELRILDRIHLVVAIDSLGASRRRDLATVVEVGTSLIATLVGSLPTVGSARNPRWMLPDGTIVVDSVAGRLWTRLSPRRATPPMLAVMNAALVLLADHEMAASALAARVAASTRAGVHDVVTAGLGALSGPLHGGESERARRVLRDAADTSSRLAIASALEVHGRLPGFGQVLYPAGDPRAALLLRMLREAGVHPALDIVDDLVAEAARQSLPPPNVDLALAALGSVAGMAPDAGSAVFTAARIVGWLAHALEEYAEQPLRFRPRAVYVGPEAR